MGEMRTVFRRLRNTLLADMTLNVNGGNAASDLGAELGGASAGLDFWLPLR